MYHPNQLADWFLSAIDREAGDTLSLLKLQKLLYYAQAWSLALHNQSLFEEDFEAWTHGPVLPSIWQRFKHYGWEAIPLSAVNYEVSLATAERELLFDILNSYGDLSAKHLEELTHAELPWQEARGNLPLEVKTNARISKQTMKESYQKLYENL